MWIWLKGNTVKSIGATRPELQLIRDYCMSKKCSHAYFYLATRFIKMDKDFWAYSMISYDLNYANLTQLLR